MYQLLLASRSEVNESVGKEVWGCIACDGIVICYVPNERQAALVLEALMEHDA